MPAEEEQNQTEAERWIEQIVNKQGKANFLGRTAFTERSEKLSLLKDIEEISWRKRKRKRYRDGKGNGRDIAKEKDIEEISWWKWILERYREGKGNGNRNGRETETETETKKRREK